MSIKNKKASKPLVKKGKIEKQMLEAKRHPAFSFCYMTTNKRYSFDWFENGKNKVEKLTTLTNLHKRFEELSGKPWEHWYNNNKKYGIETLPVTRFNFEPKDYCFTGDQRLMVLRFDQQNKRIIGFKEKDCAIMYIIGFDFEFSAYNHG